jgi:hypothetical protein
VKLKKNWAIAPESDYEFRRLAKRWKVSISQALERCAHYAAARLSQGFADDGEVKYEADIRKAQANVEMLKAQGKPE